VQVDGPVIVEPGAPEDAPHTVAITIIRARKCANEFLDYAFHYEEPDRQTGSRMCRDVGEDRGWRTEGQSVGR